MDAAIDRALVDAAARGVTGPAVTPIVLAAIAEATGGTAVRANLALAENNARLAAELAVRLSSLDG
jgi:pseudouridine-5'-phosphate glycosidase